MMNFTPVIRYGSLRPEIAGTCEVFSSSSGLACGKPSAQLVTTGCENEHLGADELCQDCAENFAAASWLRSMRCAFCDGRREVIMITPLEAEETELVG
jgi:hypothetical protein